MNAAAIIGAIILGVVSIGASIPDRSIEIPGTTFACPGDSYLTFKAGDTVGGGSWPRDGFGNLVNFTILGAWEIAVSDDPNVESLVGLWTQYGDNLAGGTVLGTGKTNFGQDPAGYGRPYTVGDEVHFHYTCSAGSYVRINGGIKITVP